MKVHRRAAWTSILAVLTVSTSLVADDFLIRLELTHGHLAELFIGCATGAGDGYDRGKDDFAPPPGIETGYTVLAPPVENLPPLYKDIRAPGKKLTWRLYAKVFKDKVITVAWDPKALPEGYTFVAETGEEKIDMRKKSELSCAETRFVTFTATKRKPKSETD